MLSNEVLLVWQLENNREESQERQNYIGVQRALEGLDVGNVRFKELGIGILAFEVRRESARMVSLSVAKTRERPDGVARYFGMLKTSILSCMVAFTRRPGRRHPL